MERSKIRRIFYPKRCPACGQIVPIERDYCVCSGDGFAVIGDDFCEHCGADLENCCCSNENSVYLEHVTAPYYYAQLARIRLLEFKFSSQSQEGEFFGEKMSFRFASTFSHVKADLVTSVPMTEREKEKRGYNQSEILARSVARHLFLPYRSVILKTGESERQHNLTQKERLENLKGIFDTSDKSAVAGKTVILCDDIKTTGTTLRRCCDVLFSSGAKDVYCLCAAATDFSFNF